MHDWVAFLLLSAAECFLLTLFPALNFIIIILWGATLILAGVYLDRRQLIIIYLADLVILFLFLGSESTMVIMLFFGIAGLTMSYLANAGKNYYFIQGSGMIAAMISVSLFLFLFYFGSDQTGSAQLDTELNIYMQEALDEFAQTDLFQLYKEQGITIEEMRAVFKQVAVIIYHHLPALYYLQAIMAVFFMLFFAHLASQTLSINRLRKKPYIMEIMPWQLVWVFITGIGLWLWGREGTSAIYYAGSNILAVMTPVAIYYGFSVCWYVFTRIPIKRKIWFIALIVFVIIAFTLPIIILLGLLGLFDALLDYRKIRLNRRVNP